MNFIKESDAAFSRGRSLSQSFINFWKAASRKLHTWAGKEDNGMAGVDTLRRKRVESCLSQHPCDLPEPSVTDYLHPKNRRVGYPWSREVSTWERLSGVGLRKRGLSLDGHRVTPWP